MPLINLIQEQRLANGRAIARARGAMYALVSAAFATLAGYALLSFNAHVLKAQIQTYTAQTQKLAPVVDEIQKSQALQAKLQPRLDMLQSAQKATGRWADILTSLMTQTPADTWLTALRSSGLQADKPVNLVLAGTAKSQEPIGEFMLRIENQPELQNVSLHFTQQKLSLNGNAIDFEFGADIAGTVDKPKTVKEDTGVTKA